MPKKASNKSILVTGGTGYIGSHTVVELLAAGYDVVILDNFSNSSQNVIQRIRQVSVADGQVILEEGDIRDAEFLNSLFDRYDFNAVVHFAGLKAVGESVKNPIDYYQNNVVGSLNLFHAMANHGCHRIVFSSSATVYGDPESAPITEKFPLSATNPYGQSKLMIEDILRDLHSANSDWQVAILRYFNPVAAHPSGMIGEDPSGIPNNLVPYIAQVAVGRRDRLTVHGSDYDTPDGTGVRDYIHVVDLAHAHVAALAHLTTEHGCSAYNIGTGVGYSVLAVVKAFEQACGKEIAYEFGPRRAGDIACCYADVGRANRELDWYAKADLKAMMQDHWRWQFNNPQGYPTGN